MHIYFRKIYKFIKTIHKSLSYKSLIYKILHVKANLVYFYKKVSQSHSSTFFTPAVLDEGQPPVHNLHLNCKTRENSNFWKNGKIVISVKNPKFIL